MKKMLFFSYFLTMLLVGCSSPTTNEQALFSPSDQGCLVLNYHRLRTPNWFIKTIAKLTKDNELNVYSIYTDDFEKQILYLKKKKISFINPDDLSAYVAGTKPMPKKCALITFDDIDVSVYKYAYPFLTKQNIPFSVFIITGEVGNPDFAGLEMVTWPQLHEMSRSKLVTIGTHTNKLHYVEKDGQPPFVKEKNRKLFEKDTIEAKQIYQQQFGKQPLYFAYPYGYGIPQTDEFLLKQNYDLLFSLQPGIVQQGDVNFFVKRVLIDQEAWKTVAQWAAK